MTTTLVLHSGPVENFTHPGGTAVIVGDPPQWDDASDATYAVAESPVSGSTSSPFAAFDAVEMTQLTAARITVRYSTGYPDGTLPSGPPRVMFYEFWADHDDLTYVIRIGSTDSGHPALEDDDAIHEFTYDLFPAPWMSDEDAAAAEPTYRGVLSGGALVNFFAGRGGLSGLRHAFATIYEVTLEVDYEGGEVLVTRLWPRDDALGAGSANRLVPPPRANRIVGRQP